LDGETVGNVTVDEIKKQLQDWTNIASEAAGKPPTGIPTAPPEGPAPQNPDIKDIKGGAA
jgi:predicted Zn-dependent peptidase